MSRKQWTLLAGTVLGLIASALYLFPQTRPAAPVVDGVAKVVKAAGEAQLEDCARLGEDGRCARDKNGSPRFLGQVQLVDGGTCVCR